MDFDADGDTDADGVCDDMDACSGDDATGDTDGDAVCDDMDACTGNDDSGDTDLEVRQTEHYFLDLPKLSAELGAYLGSGKDHWRPSVLHFARNYVRDLRGRPITRDIDWGIELPVDDLGPGKRIYVWYDAVIGYLSASKEWAAASGDPDAWVDISKALPLLAQREWYSRVPFGYADVMEPVREAVLHRRQPGPGGHGRGHTMDPLVLAGQVGQGIGYFRAALVQIRHGLAENGRQGGRQRIAAKGRLAGQQLIEQDPKSPDVGPVVQGLSLAGFGAQIGSRAHHYQELFTEIGMETVASPEEDGIRKPSGR